MNKDNSQFDQNSADYPNGYISEIHSHEPSTSDIEKFKKLYLPNSKANNKPSEESIEKANGLNYSKPDTIQ